MPLVVCVCVSHLDIIEMTSTGKRKYVSRKRRRRCDTAIECAPMHIHNEEVEAELLPLHNVLSIVHSAIPDLSFLDQLPDETAIGLKLRKSKKLLLKKSFKTLIQQCLAEFIQVIATKLWMDKSKNTFTDEDILAAMESLGISQYSIILRLFMNDYREMVFDVLTRRLNRSLAGVSLEDIPSFAQLANDPSPRDG